MASPAASSPADQPRHRRREHVVPDGRLPVSELLFDRQGAPSPFGDDQTFPLPAESLRYRHG